MERLILLFGRRNVQKIRKPDPLSHAGMPREWPLACAPIDPAARRALGAAFKRISFFWTASLINGCS